MDITKQALDLIQVTAQKAQAASVITLPEPRQYAVQHGDQLDYRDIPPQPRAHIVETLGDLIVYANKVTESGPGLECVIWHCEDQVQLIIDDLSDRRDTVTFPLTPSPKFLALTQLEKEKPELQQKELIRLLRLELNVDPATIAIFRKLDWSNSMSASGTIDRGKESLGRTIESRVEGSQELPEVIIVPVPIYSNLHEDEIYSIRCLVEFNAQAARIQIVPQPDELQYTLHVHQMHIRRRLDELLTGDKPAAVYYGRP